MRDDVVWIRVKAVEMKRSGWMLHIPYFEQRANGLDVESVQKKKGYSSNDNLLSPYCLFW